MIKRNDYGCAWMGTSTLAPHLMSMLVFSVISRDSYLSLLLARSLVRAHSLFFLSLSSPLYLYFALRHQHCSRRMTTNNNSKSDSLPSPSLVPSFNHHRFVSFGPTVSPIVDVASIATAVFSSFSSFSMLRSYDNCNCVSYYN